MIGMPELDEWESFYLIVGGAAGALIGLQFIFMTLLASRRDRPAPEASEAYGTPTIVHFSAALLIAAVLRVPWRSKTSVDAVCAFLGLVGVGYIIVVIRRMLRQKEYKPYPEDWIYYAVLPGVGYLVFAVSSFLIISEPTFALFGMALSSLMLLFIGIRNSWDTVTYHVLSKRTEQPEPVAEPNDS